MQYITLTRQIWAMLRTSLVWKKLQYIVFSLPYLQQMEILHHFSLAQCLSLSLTFLKMNIWNFLWWKGTLLCFRAGQSCNSVPPLLSNIQSRLWQSYYPALPLSIRLHKPFLLFLTNFRWDPCLHVQLYNILCSSLLNMRDSQSDPSRPLSASLQHGANPVPVAGCS